MVTVSQFIWDSMDLVAAAPAWIPAAGTADAATASVRAAASRLFFMCIEESSFFIRIVILFLSLWMNFVTEYIST